MRGGERQRDCKYAVSPGTSPKGDCYRSKEAEIKETHESPELSKRAGGKDEILVRRFPYCSPDKGYSHKPDDMASKKGGEERKKEKNL